MSSKKNEDSDDRWAWLEPTSWWWISQIRICRDGRKKNYKKKILQYIHFWCEIDQKQFMNERRSSTSERGVAIPYHQSTLCPDVHYRVSTIFKNVPKDQFYRKSRNQTLNFWSLYPKLKTTLMYTLGCLIFPKMLKRPIFADNGKIKLWFFKVFSKLKLP